MKEPAKRLRKGVLGKGGLIKGGLSTAAGSMMAHVPQQRTIGLALFPDPLVPGSGVSIPQLPAAIASPTGPHG